ncbi:penicillin-binding protein 1C [Zhouia spongiae]|uniref:peptidoglycan glycosyltransferase n=1 Tax=Zhouia spongiae TaxID=2202721 RepID=A0ABY3YRC8_9FLAO|nr:penicillin-binding protein 1C [Zhouia spongiae]UNZ00057.1 penicillin-binding protein 1C [Zhouia spongiae]
MKQRLLTFVKKHPFKLSVICLLLVAYYFCLPKHLFRDPTATVIESNDGKLLAAKIADDGQWRFPEVDSVPFKFAQCIIQFEDAYFYQHPGFNPVSIAKSFIQNIKSGRVVRGGSTLTQQVIRLSRKGKNRTYFEKLNELVLATRLELRASKTDILKLYTSHAPYGGNVVGLDVASWRYFGVQPHQLSWAESATLAVLPNAPALIYPGKNQEQLRRKRNHLLKKLFKEEVIDSLTYELSVLEELPEKPYALPSIAPHLLHRIDKDYKGRRLRTTIDLDLQTQINQVVKQHYEILRQNEIHNAAVMVMDVSNRKVLAYIGNTPTDNLHEKDVDIIGAPRSTGSIIKPLLYAAMLDNGELLPDALVADVPTKIAGYQPENYNKVYYGAIPAKRALARSLNIPSVRLLQEYGLDRFRDELKKFNLKDINRSADHYGLTLILGGAESNLWDVTKTYANLASTLNHYNQTSSEYYTNELREPVIMASDPVSFSERSQEKISYGAGSIFLTFEAMKEVNRPEGEEAWEFFDSSKQIAWKTGTSFGNRDAWAVGVTKKYAVGVWVGNADGEGRPDLTGVRSAAPILFDVFDLLPNTQWFDTPFDDLTEVEVCSKSGYLASGICPKTKTLIPPNGQRFKACTFHQLVHLDQQKQFRVNTSCMKPDKILTQPWFVLPPLMSYYYKNNNADYKDLPPYKSNCIIATTPAMDFIIPKPNAEIILTKGFDGKLNELILKLAHSRPETTVFWYMDETFIGQTKNFHELAVLPDEGFHTLTVVDEFGNELKQALKIETTL